MKGELNGYKIEIPDPPVVGGWAAVEFRVGKKGEKYALWDDDAWCVEDCRGDYDVDQPVWIMRRKPRRRIVFEECGEPTRDDQGRVFFEKPSGGVGWCSIESAGACRVDSYRWLRRTDEEVGG